MTIAASRRMDALGPRRDGWDALVPAQHIADSWLNHELLKCNEALLHLENLQSSQSSTLKWKIVESCAKSQVPKVRSDSADSDFGYFPLKQKARLPPWRSHLMGACWNYSYDWGPRCGFMVAATVSFIINDIVEAFFSLTRSHSDRHFGQGSCNHAFGARRIAKGNKSKCAAACFRIPS